MRTVSYDSFRSRTHDFISLSCTPNNEECTQAGADTHAQKLECKALINQLIRLHGEPPPGCEFCIVSNDHDFGRYYEAGIIYPQCDDNFQLQVDEGLITQEEADAKEEANDVVWNYINKCEAIPDYWDDDAKAELYRAEHPRYCAKIVQLKTA